MDNGRPTFNNILIYDIVIFAYQLGLEFDSMDDPHLLEKGRLARLASAQQKQFHLKWVQSQNMPLKSRIVEFEMCKQ